MKVYVLLTTSGKIKGVFDTKPENDDDKIIECTLNERIETLEYRYIVIPLWDLHHDEAHLAKTKKVETREEALIYKRELESEGNATYEEIRILPLQYKDRKCE